MFNHEDMIEILELTNYELLYHIDSLEYDGYEKIVNFPYYICFVPKDCLVAPLICSHIDIASKRYPSKEEIEHKEGVLSLKKTEEYKRGQILGGDDRCGVIVMLEALKNKLPYIIAFFNFEEPNNGAGEGSRRFGREQTEVLTKSSMFIGLDWIRKQEFAMYEYGSEKCSKILRDALKLEEKRHIAFTDCAILATFHKKPAIAISVGYFNQHSSSEHIIVAETQQAYRQLEKLYNEFYDDYWVVLDDVESIDNYLKKVEKVISKGIDWH